MTQSRPFENIRIIDVTRVLAGPFATYQMALLGADVIKIEDPMSHGDFSRHKAGDDPSLANHAMATNFLSTNSNKRSLTLNLRKKDGQEIFWKLANTADVIVENLRTGTMAQYGLGYESMQELNPRLIYCSLTGYGSTGPKRRHPAYDPVIQAASGMMSITGTTETAPLKCGASVVDYGAGFAAAFAVASALLQRERTGKGQYIDVSMLDTAFALMGNVVTEVLISGAVPRPWGNSVGPSTPVNASFQTRDAPLWVAAAERHQVDNFWRVIGREDIPLDPRFATEAARRANVTILREEIERTLMTKAAEEWETALNEAGVPAMQVRSIPDALTQVQMTGRSLFHTFESIPGFGRATVPLLPFQMSGADMGVRSPPPRLGEHSREVLAELGYSETEITDLQSSQTV